MLSTNGSHDPSRYPHSGHLTPSHAKSVGVAAGHLLLDHPLHDHVLLDTPAQLVCLGRVEMDEVLKLERELSAEHPHVIEVAAQEHLVHAMQVLFVEEVVVAQQLAVHLDLW